MFVARRLLYELRQAQKCDSKRHLILYIVCIYLVYKKNIFVIKKCKECIYVFAQ